MNENLRIIVAVVCILVVGFLGYKVLFPGDEVVPLLVQAVEGSVHHVDQRGTRESVAPGLILEHSSRLETDANGRAFLALGGGSTLTVDQASSVRILDVSPDGVRMELDGGSVEATVRPERGSVGIVNRDREVVGRDGTFAVGVNPSGNMAVESHDGDVELIGIGQVATLAQGERLLLLSDGTPKVAAIPESLLLEVAWPESARTRHAEVAVRGLTDPGAEVRVGASGRWTTVVADAEGHFEAAISLDEGDNPLHVVSRDPLGRTSEDQKLVTRDSQPPSSASFEVQY